jgi:hypothetical protein
MNRSFPIANNASSTESLTCTRLMNVLGNLILRWYSWITRSSLPRPGGGSWLFLSIPNGASPEESSHCTPRLSDVVRHDAKFSLRLYLTRELRVLILQSANIAIYFFNGLLYKRFIFQLTHPFYSTNCIG